MVKNPSLKEKIELLTSGKLTCEENAKTFLAEIEKKNKNLNILLEINEKTLENAKKLDKKRENKEKLGKLYGLVIGVKSLISVKDLTISSASKTIETHKGTFNADIIERIEAEDGIIIGTLNQDEFASGSSGENSAFGKTLNPKAESRIPGGSSSGSAAAVAANFCDIALGTDTGGSIRNPASHCGVVGIKPSYGRVSRYGAIDLAMSFDQIGPLAADSFGASLMLEVIAGQSDNDPTTFENKVEEYSKSKPKNKYKFGIIKGYEKFITDKEIEESFKKRVDQLKEKGHEIKEIKLDQINLAIQAYYPIVYAEFFSGTRKFDGIKYGKIIEESCGPEALRRIMGGKEISRSEFDGAYYKKALRVRELITEEFNEAFKEVDIILTPVTPMLPHIFGSTLTAEQMYAYDAFTIPANLAGICGAVVPNTSIKKEEEEIPIGIQLLANKFEETKLCEIMFLFEELCK